MLFVVEAGADFRHSLDKAGITSIFSAHQPTHSPLQTTLQMNYRLTMSEDLNLKPDVNVALPIELLHGHAITHFPASSPKPSRATGGFLHSTYLTIQV